MCLLYNFQLFIITLEIHCCINYHFGQTSIFFATKCFSLEALLTSLYKFKRDDLSYQTSSFRLRIWKQKLKNNFNGKLNGKWKHFVIEKKCSSGTRFVVSLFSWINACRFKIFIIYDLFLCLFSNNKKSTSKA